MSYARWSNSAWYAFYNCNGKLSLWYDMEHIIDWDYDALVELKEYEDEATIAELIVAYDCTRDEATEALRYIDYFIEDYKEQEDEPTN